MKSPYFPKEGVRDILCGRVCRQADEMCHFGEAVDYYHYLGTALGFR